ncbi:hypothetical protein SYNTR_0101 [Candidatus Syntrophocurvum alkaliphilum]|uniref:Uncharacterized protein n=1 Tax=Candidatus Syntrophocurvum alkaliphilum TaxID=2293317 RepID=A0A6I6DB13_9FIRM|nr:hypothetical protein [Candidatus Syntrophocurvum alkaliphilum]QGT98694.1 hypothetical protein SYNTR_0101 [Candidatus Syntrophocurvum alkaliphilum]
MIRLYSTGPVENAGFETSLGLIIKVQNNNPMDSNIETIAHITVFSLNGVKSETFQSTVSVSPQASQFETVDVSELLEYEAQIRLENATNALVSIWGKDENGKLVAAHRFVQQELNLLKEYNNNKTTPKKTTNTKRKTRRRN